MKYYTKLNAYKASNVKLCMNEFQACSYGWWIFLKPINGVLVFNNYNYSKTTTQHQHKVTMLLNEVKQKSGIQDVLVVETSKSLHNDDALKDAIETINNSIKELMQTIARPKTKQKKNIDRMNTIEHLIRKKHSIQSLIERGDQ